MTIGEVATRSGLQASAIRYYEKIGLLAPPHRSSGRRIYTPEIVPQLTVIRFATEIGFTLDEVALLLHDYPEDTAARLRWGALAKAKIAQVNEVIARANTVREILASLLKCSCQKLEDCANALANSKHERGEPATNNRQMNFVSDPGSLRDVAAGNSKKTPRPRGTVEALAERSRVEIPGSSTIAGWTSPIGGPIGKHRAGRLRRARPADNDQNGPNSSLAGSRPSKSPW